MDVTSETFLIELGELDYQPGPLNSPAPEIQILLSLLSCQPMIKVHKNSIQNTRSF